MSFIGQPWLLKRPLPAPSLDLNFLATTLDSRITFTRAAGPATYFDSTGTLQTAGTNVARFDYDPVTHAPRGLLIEEARTNLLLNSATLGTQSVTVTATPYTLSFYGTGTVTLSGTSTAGPLTGTGAFPARVSLTFTPTAGTLTLTVSGSVLNANLEAGSIATSYVTTAGASASRAADVATMPVGGWFNASAMTLATEGTSQTNQSGNSAFAAISDNTGSNLILSYFAGTQARIAVSLASVGILGGIGGIVTSSTIVKTAISLQSGNSIGTMAGVVVSTSSTIFATPTLTRLDIGWQSPFGGQLNGTIRRLRYWPRAISAAELQAVTR